MFILSVCPTVPITGKFTGGKIRQIVVNKAVAVSQLIQCEIEESIQSETKKFPKIASEIDIYNRNSREILVFEDAIQVRGQKENRDIKQDIIKKADE